MKTNNKKNIILLIIIYFLIVLTILGLLIVLTKKNSNKSIEYSESESLINQEHNEDVLKLPLATKQLNVKEEENPTILFGSDYQGDYRYESFNNLVTVLKDKIEPNLFVMCGDYQVSKQEYYSLSEAGMLELSNIFYRNFNNIPLLFVQGNHDYRDTYGLATTGLYQSKKYNIYVLNNEDYPNNQGELDNSEEIVKNSAEKLESQLQKLVDEKDKRAIFIAAHVPLHYSNRNNGDDNKYAKYIIEVLNDYGDKLDIVYLYGHNHSGKYDDYMGGSINYIENGNTMLEGGSNQEVKINFTYMNAGYVGYSNNTVNDNSTNKTSISSITINSNSLSIQRYTKEGIYYSSPITIKLNNL